MDIEDHSCLILLSLQTYLDRDLWQIMWIPQSCSDVKLEVMRVLNQVLTKSQVL